MFKQIGRITLLLALTFCTTLSTAQITTGSISGKVIDSAGEGLIGATILATHTPSGTNYGTTTRDDGGYALANLRVGGPYSIEISYVGYTTQTIENLSVSLGKRIPVNVTMTDDAVTLEGVEVVADRTGLIRKDKTGAETSVGRDQLNRLPSISRSASDYYRLTPSSNGNSFAGRNDQFNNFSLDGSIFNNPFGLDAATPGGQSGAQPVSLDAIEQINVSVAPYDVTRSGFTGAAIDAVTKSGTNEFTGTVFGFYRNDGMLGSKVDGESITVPSLTQIQTGFTVGFPLIKNKLFLMINTEIDNREDLGTTFVAARPGLTGENVSRVTAADLDLVRSTLMSTVGYDTGDYEGYIHKTESTKGIIKLDWNINNNHSLAATYSFLDSFKDKPAHPAAIGRRGPDATTLQFQNAGYRINNKINLAKVELRSIFGNKAANNLQIGYTKFDDSRDAASSPAPVLNINKDGIRYIVAGHEPFSINNVLSQSILQITNNFNVYAGKSTWTFGASFEKFEFDNSFNLGVNEPFGVPYSGGTFGPGFSSVADFVAFAQSGDLQPIFDHASSTFESNNTNDSWALAETNVGQFALYAQDEIAISDRFNLSIGLRMDMPLYFDTPEKIQEAIDRNCCHVPGIEWADQDGNGVVFDHTELPAQTPLFSPRVGFNYDANGDGSLSLRGGTGLFAGRFPFVWVGNQVANPNIFFYNVTDPNFKFLQVWRTNFGLDAQLKNGWTLSGDIMYTKDINSAIVRNYGINPPSGTLQGPDSRAIYTSTDRVVDGFTNAYVLGNSSIGSSFNFSTQVYKKFDNGWNTMVGYNFTDAKDASSVEAEISSDAYDRNPAIGNVNKAVAAPSLYGAKHRVFTSLTKDFKYGDGKWRTAIALFGEYAQGGTTPDDFTSDYRFSYTYSGDINGDGSGLNDLIYVPTDAELATMNFVDDAQRAAFGAYINQDEYLSGRKGQYAEKYGSLAPWYSQWDFKLIQDLNLTSGNTIQFTIDILNIGNLISSKWGVKQLPNNTQAIGVSVDGAGVPTYSFDTSLKETFGNNFNLSRWEGKVGLRFIF